jgi:nicotinamide riboside kinase
MKRHINISILGPESSGKTTLAKALSEVWNANLVHEFAREYLEKKGPKYDFEDVIEMARGQQKSEIESFDQNGLTIMDTNLYVYPLWIQEKYQKSVLWLDKVISQAPYDFHFLCYPLENWGYDPLREHPDFQDRVRFFNWFEKRLQQDGRKYEVLVGNEQERIEKANQVIDTFF